MKTEKYIKEMDGEKYLPCIMGKDNEWFIPNTHLLFQYINIEDFHNKDSYRVFKERGIVVNREMNIFPEYFDKLLWEPIIKYNQKPVYRSTMFYNVKVPFINEELIKQSVRHHRINMDTLVYVTYLNPFTDRDAVIGLDAPDVFKRKLSDVYE